MKHVTYCAIALCLSAAAQRLSPLYAVDFRVVAQSGTPVPDRSTGLTFSAFGNASIDSQGQAVFGAQINGPGVSTANNLGIWSEAGGTLSSVAVKGDHAPGVPGDGSFRSFLDLSTSVLTSSSGKIAFKSELQGTDINSSNDIGIWAGDSDSLRLVAQEGDPAPGVSGGNRFERLGKFTLNASGQAAFYSNLTGTTDHGIWSEGSGHLALVAREGDQVPGMTTGVTFKALSLPLLNSAGQSIFSAKIYGPGVIDSNDYGLWSDSSGIPELILREGDHAPGTPNGTSFTGFFTGFSPFSTNAAGQIAFQSDLIGPGVNDLNDVGIWSNESGPFQLVARSGDPAPGTAPGVNFDSFAAVSQDTAAQKSFSLSPNGQVAFWAQVRGASVDSTNDVGVWSEGTGTLELIAREGEPAPGVPGEAHFKSLFAVSVQLNSLGQTAFSATVEGEGIDHTNDQGIWVHNPSGELDIVVREGDSIEVGANDFRTFAYFSPINEFRFNDLGQVAFLATFTDNSQAILVTQLPGGQGDFDADGDVDGLDFLTWQRDPGVGSLAEWQANYPSVASQSDGDYDADGDVDGTDFLLWQRGASPHPLSAADLADWHDHFGTVVSISQVRSVPEPTSFLLVAVWLIVPSIAIRDGNDAAQQT